MISSCDHNVLSINHWNYWNVTKRKTSILVYIRNQILPSNLDSIPENYHASQNTQPKIVKDRNTIRILPWYMLCIHIQRKTPFSFCACVRAKWIIREREREGESEYQIAKKEPHRIRSNRKSYQQARMLFYVFVHHWPTFYSSLS